MENLKIITNVDQESVYIQQVIFIPENGKIIPNMEKVKWIILIGKYTSKNGEIYEGEFVNGKKEGDGQLIIKYRCVHKK